MGSNRVSTRLAAAGVLAASLAVTQAVAGPVVETYAGNLNDPGNAALVWSDLGAPQFLPTGDPADNVALYTLTLPSLSVVSFKSTSLAGGGILAYLSLFDAAGVLVDSSYSDTVTNGVDFDFSDTLAAGIYRLALSANQNFSSAENYGSGTLADGFIAAGGIPFGDFGTLGDYSYAFTAAFAASSPSTVPEPGTLGLVLLGSALAGLVRSKFRAARRA
jgi:hypothetical protein